MVLVLLSKLEPSSMVFARGANDNFAVFACARLCAMTRAEMLVRQVSAASVACLVFTMGATLCLYTLLLARHASHLPLHAEIILSVLYGEILRWFVYSTTTAT